MAAGPSGNAGGRGGPERPDRFRYRSRADLLAHDLGLWDGGRQQGPQDRRVWDRLNRPRGHSRGGSVNRGFDEPGAQLRPRAGLRLLAIPLGLLDRPGRRRLRRRVALQPLHLDHRLILPSIVLFLALLAGPAWADEAGLPTGQADATFQAPTLQEKYSGGFKDDYLEERGRVRTFLNLAEQNISTQLGLLQYGRGFYHPVVIRFDDGIPAISENPFFYVEPTSDSKGFRQALVANVEAFARRRRESSWKDPALRNGFYYAMVELMLNDLTAGHDGNLPVWVREGLAVYVSGDGDSFVDEVAERVPRSKVARLVGELNRPAQFLSQREWARYYLAIKYIFDTGGVNAFQGFVRNVVGEKSAADAILDTLSQEWPTFEKNIKDYSTKAFLSFTPDDDDPKFKNWRDDSEISETH